MKLFIIRVLCILAATAILAAIVFITVKNWFYFTNPDWYSAHGVKYRIEGGHLWGLLCLWFFGGALAVFPLWIAVEVGKNIKEKIKDIEYRKYIENLKR